MRKQLKREDSQKKWSLEVVPHALQADAYNCGVMVIQVDFTFCSYM